MKLSVLLLGAVVAQVAAGSAYSQTTTSAPIDKAEARAYRNAQGAEAVRDFKPGQGNPEPDARVPVSKVERVEAAKLRLPQEVDASREFQPGGGNPIPEGTPKLTKGSRTAQ